MPYLGVFGFGGEEKVTGIDFAALREAAAGAMTRAYAPYSRFPVGAAAVTRKGELVTGCNVENVSYGLGLCAEVALVATAVSSGLLRGAEPGSADPFADGLAAVSICDAAGAVLVPCGRCRQVLREFGGDDLLVDGERGARTLGELLPDAFGPEHLQRVAGLPVPVRGSGERPGETAP